MLPQSAIRPSAESCCDLGASKRQGFSSEFFPYFFGTILDTKTFENGSDPPHGMSLDIAMGVTATSVA